MTAALILFVIATGLVGAEYAVSEGGGDKPPSLTRDVHGDR